MSNETLQCSACTDKLWRISWAILQCGAECDDALQEALLRAWQKIGGLREVRFFETWLTRILINECRRILKKRANGPQALPDTLAEKAQPESKELAEAVSVICKQNDMTPEELKPYVNKEFEDAVVRSVLSTKVMRLIRDAAEITVNET